MVILAYNILQSIRHLVDQWLFRDSMYFVFCTCSRYEGQSKNWDKIAIIIRQIFKVGVIVHEYIWYILYTCTCKCVSLTSQKRERRFELINKSSHVVTNLFILENSMWPAVVASSGGQQWLLDNTKQWCYFKLITTPTCVWQSQVILYKLSLLTWKLMHVTIPT